jgi:hypothetical protein
MRAAVAAALWAVVSAQAYAEPTHPSLLPRLAPMLLHDAPALVAVEREPRWRPIAWSFFGAALASAGTAGYFAFQSDRARGKLLGLPNPVPPGTVTQSQAIALANTATQDGQIAAALVGGTAALVAAGAALWWYGDRYAVAVSPAGVTVSGAFR